MFLSVLFQPFKDCITILMRKILPLYNNLIIFAEYYEPFKFTLMNKILRLTMMCLMALFVGANAVAEETAEVTLDFTTNNWGLPEGSSSKATASQSFTNESYTITLEAADGYYYNTQGYLMLGKSGSTLTLPAFDFDVSKIEVVGRDGASASTKQNIYVGDVAVSTETTGATGTNTYKISESYQTAGNVYVLKVTSAHNSQITAINIYKASGKESAGLAFSESSISVEQGTNFTAPTFTYATTAEITFTSDNEDVATVDASGNISLAGGTGTAVITATSEENDEYDAGSTTCTITVYIYNTYKKATTIESGKQYLIVAQRDDCTYYAYPLSSTYTYGYLSVGTISELTDEIDVKSTYDDSFTFTESGNGYTIMDSEGRYMYHSGSYNTFNVGSTPYVWSVEQFNDGTFYIEMDGYFIQWGQGTYTTFGCYNTEQDGAVYPYLYVLDETTTGIKSVTTVTTEDQELDPDAPVYNLSGQRVTKSTKGILIQNGKKFVNK